MGSRWLLVAFLALAIVPVAESGPPPLPVGRTIYVVQPDPRLCPSPRCGGYWVSRANHAETRCHDGVVRARCYVATAVAQGTGGPLPKAIAPDGLVRAALGTSDGADELGVLIVAEGWSPATPAQGSGGYFRVRDLGVRCIRAPCFWIRAWRVNRAFRVTVSNLDLEASGADTGTRARAAHALETPGGLLVRGRITRTADGGRELGATRVFLREPQPRA